MHIPINNIASSGLNLDVSPAELSATSWGIAHNVRISHGAFTSIPGDRDFISDLDFEPISITYVGRFRGMAAWLLLGLTKAALLVDAKVYDITGDMRFTADPERGWNVVVMAGLVVANNGIDPPMALVPVAHTSKLVFLPGWSVSTTAASFFGFKQHLFAFNVTTPTAHLETLVKWSHPADPGYAPAFWDITDPTRDAGETELSETPGAIVTAVPLGDQLVIYKQDAIWTAQYIGGIYIWKFTKLFEGVGVKNARSVVEFDTGKHLCFTGTDLIVHDGQSFSSIAQGRVLTLLQGFDLFQINTSYLVLDAAKTEVWLCYGRRGEATGLPVVDKALVWNYSNNAFTTRDIDEYNDVTAGQANLPQDVSEPWDEADISWPEADFRWGFSRTKPVLRRLVAVKGNRIIWVGEGDAGASRANLERTHMGVPMLASAAPDLTLRKFLSRLWPRLSGTAGTVLRIQLGVVDDVQSGIKWAAPSNYILGKTTSVPCLLTGKMFAVRLTALTAGLWKLDGMDVEIKPAGRW